jgi:hypothetical protein
MNLKKLQRLLLAVVVFALLTLTSGTATMQDEGPRLLTWAPPVLDPDATFEITVRNGDDSLNRLYEVLSQWTTGEDGKPRCVPGDKDGKVWDVVVHFDNFTGIVEFNGGRHIVVIGGSITVPVDAQMNFSDEKYHRAIKYETCEGQTEGSLHLEGLLIGSLDGNFCLDDAGNLTSAAANGDADCDATAEGIQIAAPNSVIQIQNVCVLNISAPKHTREDGIHPDGFSNWGGYEEARFDGFVSSSDYQVMLLKGNPGVESGETIIKNAVFIANPGSGFMFRVNNESPLGKITLENVWVVPRKDFEFTRAISSNTDAVLFGEDEIGNFAYWPVDHIPTIEGKIYEGLPPEMPVDCTKVGDDYVSPGYLNN